MSEDLRKGGDSLAELERLKELHDRNVISDDEFSAEKKRLIGD